MSNLDDYVEGSDDFNKAMSEVRKLENEVSESKQKQFNELESDKTVKNLQGIESTVENVLRKYPPARNSDLRLMFYIWKKKQRLDLNNWNNFKEIAKPETIRRSRQKIQNTKGKYPPTDFEIANKRNIKAEKLRKFYGELSE